MPQPRSLGMQIAQHRAFRGTKAGNYRPRTPDVPSEELFTPEEMKDIIAAANAGKAAFAKYVQALKEASQ